jgi:excisionase family DNA binding protein
MSAATARCRGDVSLEDLSGPMTIAKAAWVAGVGEGSVYREVREGRLNARRVGRRLWVSKVAFARWRDQVAG